MIYSAGFCGRYYGIKTSILLFIVAPHLEWSVETFHFIDKLLLLHSALQITNELAHFDSLYSIIVNCQPFRTDSITNFTIVPLFSLCRVYSTLINLYTAIYINGFLRVPDYVAIKFIAYTRFFSLMHCAGYSVDGFDAINSIVFWRSLQVESFSVSLVDSVITTQIYSFNSTIFVNHFYVFFRLAARNWFARDQFVSFTEFEFRFFLIWKIWMSRLNLMLHIMVWIIQLSLSDKLYGIDTNDDNYWAFNMLID